MKKLLRGRAQARRRVIAGKASRLVIPVLCRPFLGDVVLLVPPSGTHPGIRV